MIPRADPPRSITALCCVIVMVALVFGPSSGAAAPGDESWSSAYHQQGVTGLARTITSGSGGIYVCGRLTGLGRHDANGIALVSDVGGSWTVQAFGDGLTDSWGHPVQFQGQLTIAGMQTDSNGDLIYGAYAFDGSDWSRLGTYPPTASDLAVYDGELYMTGRLSIFEASSTVWKWAGSDWIPWLETDGTPRGMVVHDDQLFVTGEFTTVYLAEHIIPSTVEFAFEPKEAGTNIFAWDGSAILPLGEGFPIEITSVVTVGDQLVVTGNDGRNGGLISSWNGLAWTVLLDVDRRVDALTEWNGLLVAATDSLYDTSFATVHNPDIMVLDTGQWSSLTPFQTTAIAAVGDALLIRNPDYKGMAEDLIAPGLVVYRQGNFEAPFPEGLGFQDTRLNLTRLGGSLVAAGEFQYGGAEVMDGAGAYDGFSWTALDSFDLGLATYQEPLGFADIAAVGDNLFGIYEIHNLDFSTWSLVKRDPDPPANGVWKRFSIGSYGPSNRLQAAGSRLFTWRNSGVWEIDMVNGINTDIAPLLDGSILAACAVDWDLVIGGDFQNLNGAPSSNLVRYDGSGWSDFAPALPGEVVALRALPGDSLSAAYFTGGVHRVAIFDGLSWTDLTGDFDGPVHTLAWHQDRLVAAGYFADVGGFGASGIAVWTGTGWSGLGSGLGDLKLYGSIVDMESTADGLYISGGMRSAGGNRTSGIALWTGDLRLILDPSPVPDDVPRPADAFGLRAHPNPFNPRTAIGFEIPAPGSVSLSILDLRGRHVRTLLSGTRQAGPIEVVWDGRLDSGQPAPSGLYHLHLSWNGRTASRKLTLVR